MKRNIDKIKELERKNEVLIGRLCDLRKENDKLKTAAREISSAADAAAAAIAALQEAGNKVSRDMLAASYRSHREISTLCIELIRQFYDEARSFRITGDTGEYTFSDVSNAGIREQQVGIGSDGSPLFRKPIFDLKIKAQKKNPFSRMEQNENAKALYGMGFFNPDRWGQEAAAIYTGRREQGPGRYVFSRSCKKLPPVKPRDGAISNARLEKLARYRVDDREYWEKKFPGHKFDYCESTYNSYNGHWYLRVVMRRLSDEELRKGRGKKENANEI